MVVVQFLLQKSLTWPIFGTENLAEITTFREAQMDLNRHLGRKGGVEAINVAAPRGNTRRSYRIPWRHVVNVAPKWHAEVERRGAMVTRRIRPEGM